MGGRRFWLRTLTSAVLIICAVVMYFPAGRAFGDSSDIKQFISLDEAVNMALKNSSALKKLDLNGKDLDLQRKQLKDLKKSIEDSMENLDKMEDTVKQLKEAVNTYEQLVTQYPDNQEYKDNLASYQKQLAEVQGAMEQMKGLLEAFGISPNNLSKAGEYQKIIKHFDFPIMELDAAIDNIGLSRKAAENSVKEGVRSLFSGVLNYNDALSYQEKVYESKENQYNITLKKFQLGQVSELDRFSAESDLKIFKLNNDTTKRNIENLEMSLKKLMGIDLTRAIELVPYTSTPRELYSLDFYLKSALEKRNEIVTAKNNLKVKEKELDITEDYMDKSSTEWMEANKAVLESRFTLKDAENSVTKDIKMGYADVLKKQRALESAELKEKSSLKTLENMKISFERGYITEASLKDVENAYEFAVNSCVSAKRDYYDALGKLELASNEGPKYSGGTGGN